MININGMDNLDRINTNWKISLSSYTKEKKEKYNYVTDRNDKIVRNEKKKGVEITEMLKRKIIDMKYET